MEIYAVNFKNQFIEYDCLDIMRYIDIEKQERLKKFRFIEDRVRGLYAELLVRYILIRNYCLINKEIKFGRNNFGKPYLMNPKDIHFNYSHSGNWVACAFDCNDIGIDVEQIKDIDIDISKSFFSDEELKVLNSIEVDKKLDYFYSVWTLKESYIKAIGIGLSKELKSFTIKVTNSTNITEHNGWHLKQYDIIKNYKLAVSAQTTDFPKDIKVIPVRELSEYFVDIKSNAYN